jgi:uncharacterized membrane protein
MDRIADAPVRAGGGASSFGKGGRGMESRDDGKRRVTRSITVKRPIEDVYGFWRDPQNLARYSRHLRSVTVDGKRSHWVAEAPRGGTVEWVSEIVEEVPNALLAWRSRADSEARNEGTVWFKAAPSDRGTEVRVELRYDASGGSAGGAVAKLFGAEPEQQLRDDLRRFKQVLETGEVVLSDGSLEGAGQGASKQRPAQPQRAGANR